MRLRIILTILLSSFVLNIFHDLLITHHTPLETSQVVMLEASSDEHKTHRLCDLHKMFHFSAILISNEDFEESATLSLKLTFIEKISPTQYIESSFKPPKA